MSEYRELEAKLIVKVRAKLDDAEATEQIVRFLVEEELRENGWDVDVEVLEQNE